MRDSDESRRGHMQTAGVTTKDENIPTAVLVAITTTWPGLDAAGDAVTMVVTSSRGAWSTGDSGTGAARQGALCLTKSSLFQHGTVGMGSDTVDDARCAIAECRDHRIDWNRQNSTVVVTAGDLYTRCQTYTNISVSFHRHNARRVRVRR